MMTRVWCDGEICPRIAHCAYFKVHDTGFAHYKTRIINKYPHALARIERSRQYVRRPRVPPAARRQGARAARGAAAGRRTQRPQPRPGTRYRFRAGPGVSSKGKAAKHCREKVT